LVDEQAAALTTQTATTIADHRNRRSDLISIGIDPDATSLNGTFVQRPSPPAQCGSATRERQLCADRFAVVYL
jgi:hypothetical protein